MGFIDLTNPRLQPKDYSTENVMVDYMGGPNAIYVGHAAPGSLTNANVWSIKKITWDGNNNVIAIKWGCDTDGNPCNSCIWDNRASLTYK